MRHRRLVKARRDQRGWAFESLVSCAFDHDVILYTKTIPAFDENLTIG